MCKCIFVFVMLLCILQPMAVPIHLSYYSFLQLRAGINPIHFCDPSDVIEVPTSAGLGNEAVPGLAASKCGLMAVLEENDQEVFIYNHERRDVLRFPLDIPEFSYANQMAFDMYNNIVIAQGDVNTLPRFNMNGKELPHLDVPFNSPMGVACSPCGDIFVSFRDPCTIMKQAAGKSEWVTIYNSEDKNKIPGGHRYVPGQMSIGSDDELFVATETYINVLNTSDGIVKRQIGCDKFDDGELSKVEGICATGDGYLFVCDQDNFVHVFTTAGEYLHQFGGDGDGPGQFYQPWGIIVDWEGYLLVSDVAYGKIQIF